MSDFQRTVLFLRNLGVGVTLENDGLLQIAKVKGEKISGYFANNEDYDTEIKKTPLDKEQIKYINRLIDSKERTAQPLERLFIDELRKDLIEMVNKKGEL